MTSSRNNILAASSLIILSLFAFKGKKEKPMTLGTDLRWKTEVSYDQQANVSGYVLHNNKKTDIIIFEADDSSLKALLRKVSIIGNPVSRVIFQNNPNAFEQAEINNLKKKFPTAQFLIATQESSLNEQAGKIN